MMENLLMALAVTLYGCGMIYIKLKFDDTLKSIPSLKRIYFR